MRYELSNIFNHIKQNKYKSVENIACDLGYSRYYFSRMFKKLTGFSVSEYISSLKIEKSIYTLITKNTSILYSHMNAGFLSSSTFSSSFKKQTGLSPQKLKKDKFKIYSKVKEFEEYELEKEVIHYEKSLKTQNNCHVRIDYPKDYKNGITFVGLFNSPIPNHKPIIGKAIINKNHCTLSNIPNGKFYLLVCSLSKSKNLTDYFILKNCLRGKSDCELIFLGKDNFILDVKLREAIETDPPITINLAELLKNNMFNKKSNL